MELALLLDIGSTYTKARVVDLKSLELRAQAKILTTVDELSLGINRALLELEKQGVKLDLLKYRLACSSAAGGLKMIAIGLVLELTAEAARRAALGAGAKLSSVYAYQLSKQEVEELIAQDPDLILLAGGTDGGNQEIILKNAEALAVSTLQAPIVVAGNKVVAAEVEAILLKRGKEVYLTENVMPELEKLNIEPARKLIRELFMEQIVDAKGLNRAQKDIDQIIMPTPAAVLRAAELIADGHPKESGWGEIMVIDIGGATTDIHSVATGEPTKGGVNLRGLAEPYVKRTVEGDLGMRYTLASVVESIGESEVLNTLKAEIDAEELKAYLAKFSQDVKQLATTPLEKDLESLIAKAAIRLAVSRHVGRLEIVYGPYGQDLVQYGKDLSELELIIGTGGVLIHHQSPEQILRGALFEDDSSLLAPQEAEFILDEEYILSAVGLLAEIEELKALRFAKKYLCRIGEKFNEGGK